MLDEQLFTVRDHHAARAGAITLAEAGLREREHLQEWVLANPELLGDDVRIVTFEFDRWLASAGGDPRDRLDILGLDPSGSLVVAELKRDRAASTVEMQALKYAAMVSRFTTETLALAHAAHLTRQTGRPVGPGEALAALEEHAGGELDPTVLRRPRIVLVAGEFPQTTTATCVWLGEMGVDTTLIRYRAYRTDQGVVLTTSKLWPIPEVEDFTIAPRLTEAKEVAKSRAQRRRATSAVSRLVEADAIEVGTTFRLQPTTEVDGETRAAVEDWINRDPDRGQATWTGENPNALRWASDDRTYTPTGLVRTILLEAAELDRGTRGTSWWVNDDGDDLVALADELAGPVTVGTRDWSDLHELLRRVPPGRWTTYGDLAKAIGTAAQPLGTHVATCEDCENAWRILTADGRPSLSFRWSDPTRTDTASTVLTSEGLSFDEKGRADPARRMRWDGYGK
jgi:alkylated DNA nucleotide flippase Atl1